MREGGALSAKTQTIHVRISPGVRLWQALLVAAALVVSLLMGLVLGRASAPAVDNHPIGERELAPLMCTGHVPNPACALRVVRGDGRTAHVPVGGPPAYG